MKTANRVRDFLPTTMPALPKDRRAARAKAFDDQQFIGHLKAVCGWSEGWIPDDVRKWRRLCERIIGSWPA